jgi:hypothetical protein
MVFCKIAELFQDFKRILSIKVHSLGGIPKLTIRIKQVKFNFIIRQPWLSE